MTVPTAVPDVDALADRLAAAAARRETIPMLTAKEPGLDVAIAYRVQRAGIDRRLAEGERMIGPTLGLVSRAKHEAMGVAEPLCGLLTDGMLHDEDVPLDCATLIHPRAEPEMAFVLDRDVYAGTATVASVLAATAGVFPALEVLDSRYDDFRFTLPDVVADNGSAALIVLAAGWCPWIWSTCSTRGWCCAATARSSPPPRAQRSPGTPPSQ